MAKLPITPPTYAVNNVQQLPDIVIGDASAVKTTHDKTGSDGKDYLVNTLITELNGSTGANMIGHSNPNIAANNVADAVEEVRQIAVQAQAGAIVDNSISDSKLTADIKIGDKSSFLAGAVNDVYEAINVTFSVADQAQQDATSAGNLASTTSTLLDITRVAKTSTGSSVAYAVNTDGTFDLTKDGNRLMFVPNVANSGSCTVAVDSQTAKNTRKANDAGAYVALEASDIKQGVPTEFVWSVANDFFILRPSGGSNIKSIQSGAVSITSGQVSVNVPITTVDMSKSIVQLYIVATNSTDNGSTIFIRGELTTSTNIQFVRQASSTNAVAIYWKVIEFNNVKSMQRGITSASSVTTNVTISTVDLSKSIVFSSFHIDASAQPAQFTITTHLTTSTNLTIVIPGGSTKSVAWQVIEFK